MAIITATEIICANSGDSRCVLGRDGKAIDMSEDHKPDNTGERARIEKAGGFVEENRVKGILALSRSLGDLEYKQESKLKIEEQMITCVPEIKKEPLQATGQQFLLVACDGIWDCMTSQEGIDYCFDHLKSNPQDQLSSCLEKMFDKICAPDVASSGKSL